MDTKILEEIGLTKNEIKVYLALIKIGQTTTTQIIKDSKINPSKIYNSLDKLIQKGLATYTIKANKKFFMASSPENLKQILIEKREKLEKEEKEVEIIIGSLNEFKKKDDDLIETQTYEGVRGLKSYSDKILEILGEGETQYIIGVPKIANDQLEGYLLDWHKKRIKKGINCKYLFQSDAKHYGKIREKMKNTHVRYLPDEISSPMWIEIFGDYVAIGHVKKYNAIVFLIHDREIAKGYLNYFNMIWKSSSK